MSVAEAPFEIFGEKSSFALEIRSLPTAAVSGAEPEDWRAHGVSGVFGSLT